MSRVIPASPEYLRAMTIGRPTQVDREKNVLRGYVVAQAGPFKSAGRGQFDLASLQSIVKLGNASPKGLLSRFGHEGPCDDSPGKHLGRSTNFTLSTAVDARTGKTVPAVRGDLLFDKTALAPPPNGGTPYGEYVMTLAESDSGAISSSLVVTGLEYFLPNNRGELTQVQPEEIPDDAIPIWRPTALRGSDIVTVGDAVDGLLSAGVDVESLPQAELLKAQHMLTSYFDGYDRDVVESRLLLWANSYVQSVYGPSEDSELFKLACRLHRKSKAGMSYETPTLDKYRKSLLRMESVVK